MTPNGYNLPSPQELSLHNQTGATWGLAWQRGTKTLYTSAYIKQFTDLGPGGTGAIYKINLVNPLAPLVSGHIDLNAIFGPTTFGPNPFIPYPDFNNVTDRNAVADAVLTAGIGDIDVSEDDKWLYVTNLYNKKIYCIPIDGSPINSSTIIVSPTVPYETSTFFPFNTIPGYPSTMPLSSVIASALCVKGEKVYIAVCVGKTERIYTGANPEFLGNVGGFYIYEYDRITNSFSSTPILKSDVATMGSAEFDRRGYEKYYSSFISDFNFNTDGGISISLRNLSIDASGGAGGTYLLKACSVGANLWQFEDFEGTCGGKTTGGHISGGIGRWYDETKDVENSYKSGFGASAQIPGFRYITATNYDPFNTYAAGLLQIDNATGKYYRSVEYQNIVSIPPLSGVEWDQKRGVLGDVEALSDVAPLEIGNRVWMDTDSDGVQDADEMGLDGIQVKLYSGTTLVATKTTANGGQYYFKTDDGVLPNTSYIIRIESGNFPSGKFVTLKDQMTGGNQDFADNDASLVSANADIIYKTGNPGENNHNLDFGFSLIPVTNCDPDSIKICAGQTAELVADDGYFNYKWFLINAPGDTVEVASGQTFTTTTNGHYIYKASDGSGCPVQMCCPVIVADSICCVIANLALQIGACNNKGTSTDASDDEYTFTLSPTGNGLGSNYTVSGLPNGPQVGSYGAPTVFGPYLISAGTLNITVTDNSSGNCSLGATVSPPPSCSACNLAPPVLVVNDNICPSRIGTITLVQGCGTGSFVQYSTNSGATWSMAKPFYTTVSKTILARCVLTSDTTCKSSTFSIATDPKKCPGSGFECSLLATAIVDPCQNNGTADVPTDDYFTIQVNATSSNGGASQRYEVVIGADLPSGVGGNVLNSGGTNYGSPVTIGQNKQFKADGLSSYTLIVRDMDTKNCFQQVNLTPVASCSSLPPKSPCYPVPCVPIELNKN